MKKRMKEGLATVENLIIAGPIEARIDAFIEFLEWMPRLKSLDLRNLEVFRSEEKQFYDALIPYIARHSTTLKGVLFQKDYKPENLEKYKRLVEIKDLCLNQVAVTALQNWKWSETEYNFFRQFLQTNNQLQELRISAAQQLEWQPLMEIIKEQKHLKQLEIDNFPFFLAVDYGLLKLLPQIESIIFEDSMESQLPFLVHLDPNAVPTVNHTLKELIVSKIYSVYTPTWLHCEFKALTRLEMRDCELDDAHVHLMCEKLPLLQDLTITSAYITDFAVTGRPPRKSKTPSEKTQIAIVDLKHLKKLALDYDDKITSHAFEEFDTNGHSLCSLSLEGCERINYTTIRNIVTHCPNLVYLNISYCNKIKDDSIELICQGLQKLRKLKINELPAVTGNVFEQIGKHAKCLQYLHMKDYVKVKDRYTLARVLFASLDGLRLVKMESREEIYRYHEGK